MALGRRQLRRRWHRGTPEYSDGNFEQNCQQCHAPSSELDQTLLVSEPGFLSAPEIE